MYIRIGIPGSDVITQDFRPFFRIGHGTAIQVIVEDEHIISLHVRREVRTDGTFQEGRFSQLLTILDDSGEHIFYREPGALELLRAERLLNVFLYLIYFFLSDSLLGSNYNPAGVSRFLETAQEISFNIKLVEICVSLYRIGEAFTASKTSGVVKPSFATYTKFFRFATKGAVDVLCDFRLACSGMRLRMSAFSLTLLTSNVEYLFMRRDDEKRNI